MDNGFYLGTGARRVVLLFATVAAIFCAYLIVSAVITAQNTGLLKISASDNGVISVSQISTQAMIIGAPGQGQVRLKPGRYQVIATAGDGKQAAKVVSVEKQQTTDISLKLRTAPKLRSIDDVTFFGTSSLTDQGITSEQMDTLKLDFFRFDTSADSVRIDSQSVRAAPHVLGSPFVIGFDVIIGPRTYDARISYSDTSNIRLQLYEQNGHQAYDSYTPSNVKNLD